MKGIRLKYQRIWGMTARWCAYSESEDGLQFNPFYVFNPKNTLEDVCFKLMIRKMKIENRRLRK